MVLAGGATAWRDLPIPGRDLDGIHQAMEYLPWANRVQQGDPVLGDDGQPPITAKGKKVIIIGGGDTGADCLGTAHRQGAASVHQFEIMPRPPETRADSTPWPTYPLMFRVSSAHEEGGERVFSVNTEEFVGEDGRVTGAEGARGRDERAASSRRSKAATSSWRPTWSCSRWASSDPRSEGLLTDLGVEFTDRGNVARDADFADLGAGRVRRRRHGPRPVADRVGDRRGPRRGRRGRPLPDGPAPRCRRRSSPPRHRSAERLRVDPERDAQPAMQPRNRFGTVIWSHIRSLQSH